MYPLEEQGTVWHQKHLVQLVSTYDIYSINVLGLLSNFLVSGLGMVKETLKFFSLFMAICISRSTRLVFCSHNFGMYGI